MRWVFLTTFCFIFLQSNPWGFFAHKEINYLACFSLPQEMFGFYKQNIELIREWAVRADQRRYVIDAEAPRHYIDLDHYEVASPIDTVPILWKDAVAKYGEEHLNEYGIVPWYVNLMRYKLTEAFKAKDFSKIVKYSADLGHYISDAHVPLHTTQNYNGQLTDQVGIHGLWESRLPEVFATNYDFFVGKAQYLNNPQQTIWNVIQESFSAKDSVLFIEKELTKTMPSTKYSFETRGASTVKVYSKMFSKQYHNNLNQMVERRMQKAILVTGSFWFTAWVDAGQPKLDFTRNQRVDLQKQIDSLNKVIYNTPIKGRMETH
mgnify:CR=1 FL=1